MKRDNINYLVVGTFVLTLLVLLMMLLYQLTGSSGPTDSYRVTYDNVAGIKYGTPVLYEGYQVGQVESIEPARTSDGMQYELQLSVVEDWQIPADSVAKVVASGLLATMTIEIQEGSSDRMLEPGSEIAGREAVSLFAAVNDVAANFKQLSDDSVRPLLDKLSSNLDQLTNELVQLTRDDIRPIFNNIEHKLDEAVFIEQLNQLTAKLNNSADELQGVLNKDNREHINNTLGNLQEASGNLNVLLNNIETTRGNMDEVLGSIDGLVSDNQKDLQASIRELRTALETISANIDAITYHMEGTSRNMHEFSRHLRANPGALLRSPTPPDEASSQESSQ